MTTMVLMSTENEGPVPSEAPNAFGFSRHDRGPGRLVYPTISRRSGGLSLGINLFPDAKLCSFDCPYCEVFPARDGAPFSLDTLRDELTAFFSRDCPGLWSAEPVRDLCFSGNGEPTLSPHFEKALWLCADMLDRKKKSEPRRFGETRLILISNATGFLDLERAALLARAVDELGLVIWAKLDGGNERMFKLMSRSAFSLAALREGIARFAERRPLVIQSMFCELRGESPSDHDVLDYARLVSTFAAPASGVDSPAAGVVELQLYTQARPSPENITAPLSDRRLLAIADIVRDNCPLAFRVFGAAGELFFP